MKSSIDNEDDKKNAYNQRNISHYKYQDKDIVTIAATLLDANKVAVGIYKNHVLGSDDKLLLKNIKENFPNLDKPIIGIYNKDQDHWVTFCLGHDKNQQVVLLYKDSFGHNCPEEIKECAKHYNAKVLEHKGGEQTGKNVCGIAALKNAEIIADNIAHETKKDDFITDFSKQEFCTQEEAEHLRKHDFATKYIEGIRKIAEQEHTNAEICKQVSTHHHKELEQLHKIIDESDKIKGINIVVTKDTLLQQQNKYDYTYHIEFVEPLSQQNLGQSQDILNQILQSLNLTVADVTLNTANAGRIITSINIIPSKVSNIDKAAKLDIQPIWMNADAQIEIEKLIKEVKEIKVQNIERSKQDYSTIFDSIPIPKKLTNKAKYNESVSANKNKPTQIKPETVKTVIVQDKASHNAFNQSDNFRYKYSDADIDVIARKLLDNSTDYLGIIENLTGEQLQRQIKTLSQNFGKLLGIYKDQGCYAVLRIHNQDGTISCNYKNSLGKKIEKLEQEFGELINKSQIQQSEIEIVQEGRVDQHTKSSSAIFVLKNLEYWNKERQLNNIDNHNKLEDHNNDHFYTAKTLKNIAQTRKELAEVYLDAVKDKYENVTWDNNTRMIEQLEEAEEVLSALNPLTEDQFKQLSGLNDHNNHKSQQILAKLLNAAIERQNSHLVKLVLKAGLRVNDGIEIEGTGNKASFLTVLERAESNHGSLRELNQIGKLLKKYGCADKVTLTAEELRQKDHSKTLKEVAGHNNVDVKLYEEFTELFKATFETTIVGLRSVASGMVAQYLPLEHQFAAALLKQVPVAGSALSGAYSAGVKIHKKAKATELQKYFSSSNKFIEDYCVRIIKHYGEEIVNLTKLTLPQQLTKAVNDVMLGNPKKFIHGSKDYTEYWHKLISQYIQNFLKFLFTKEAQDNFANKDSFGAIAAKQLFEYHKVTKEEVTNITHEFSKDNVKTFAKLTSYISEIAKYPKSISNLQLGEVYYSDTENRAKEAGIDAKSLIIANKEKIIIAFHTEKQSKKHDSKTKEVMEGKGTLKGGILLPANLYDIFDKFEDHAEYYSAQEAGRGGQGAENGGISEHAKTLKAILREYSSTYPNATVYLAGDNVGSFLAAMTQVILVDRYKLNPEQINLYTYGAQPWCHESSVDKAKELLLNYYRVLLVDDEQMSDYVSLGKVMYLKAGHLLTDTQFKALKTQPDKKQPNNSIKNYINEFTRQDNQIDKKLEQLHERELYGDNSAGLDDSFEEINDELLEKKAQNTTLYEAVENGDLKLVQYLIEEKRSDVNTILIPDSDKRNKYTLLHYAAKNIDFEMIKYLVEKGAGVNTNSYFRPNDHYIAPLNQVFSAMIDEKYSLNKGYHYRIKDNEYVKKIVKYLIENGANINQCETHGAHSRNAPIHYAAKTGDLEFVKYFVSKGANFKIKDSSYLWYGHTALKYAVESGNLELVKYLVEDLELSVNDKGAFSDSVLSKAPQAIAKYLVSKGANTNLSSNFGSSLMIGLDLHHDTPLHDAVSTNDIKLVQLLLANGAKINSKGMSKLTDEHNNDTPLHYSLNYKINNLKIFKLLIESGADLNIRNKQRKSSLDLLQSKSDNPSVTQYLTLLKLQGKIPNEPLTFDKYKETFNELLAKGCSWYSLSTYFVSECIRLKNDINDKISKTVNKIEQNKLKAQENTLTLNHIQFFEGNDKIQIYNKAIKLLLSYSNSSRLIEALKICSEFLSNNSEDQAFLFLKGVICISEAGGDISTKKAAYFIGETEKILIKLEQSSERSYLEGELLYLQGNMAYAVTSNKVLNSSSITTLEEVRKLYEEALKYYQQANKLDHYFNHPKARAEHLKSQLDKLDEALYLIDKQLDRQGYKVYAKVSNEEIDSYEERMDYEADFARENLYGGSYFSSPEARIVTAKAPKERSKDLDKEILSIDVELMLQDIEDAQDTNAFMDQSSAKASQQQHFDDALHKALTVDVLHIKDELKQLLPKKYSKSKLIDSHKKSFQVKKLLDKLDYAYDKMSKTLGGKIFSKKDFVPEDKSHEFFSKVTSLTDKLKILKHVANQWDPFKDFTGGKKAQDKFISLIDNLLDYYDEYATRVVADYQYSQDPNYLKKFNKGTGKKLDIKKSVIVFTEKQLTVPTKTTEHQNETREKTKDLTKTLESPYLLKRDASKALTIKEPGSEQKYGTHKVIAWPPEGDNQVYYKYFPYAPGIEFAVSSLYKQILPSSTPETMLLKLTDGKQHAIYLASKAITGRNFAEVANQKDIIQTIKPENFSGLFLASLIACTGDAKPDNFVLHFNYDARGLKSTELVSIDNDIAFCRNKLKIATQNVNGAQQKKLYSEVLNILYLMPQMDLPVSSVIKSHLLEITNQPELIVARWLNELQQKNTVYEHLTKDKNGGFNIQELDRVNLPIQLPGSSALEPDRSNTAVTVYKQLTKIKQLLKSEAVTHHDIFKQLHPDLAYFYQKSRDSSSIVNSLKQLYVAAGADPALAESLFHHDKLTSLKAWNTMSASKRKDPAEFKKIYNSTIEREAEKFIAAIDFGSKYGEEGELVILSIREQLPFVSKLELHKINEQQLEQLLDRSEGKDIFFKNTEIKVIDGQMSVERKQHLEAKYRKLYNNSFEIQSLANLEQQQPHVVAENIVNTQEVQPLQIADLWDLARSETRPADIELTNDGLMQTLKERKWDINELGSDANTLLHTAALRNDLKLIKILLDCGIDQDSRNIDGQTVLDLEICKKNPEIILAILEHQPRYLQKLLQQGKVAEAEIIAKSSCSGYMTAISLDLDTDKELAHEADSILKKALQDRAFLNIARVALQKADKTIEADLLYLFVKNYKDTDLEILELLLKCDSSLIKDIEAVDLAYNNKQYNILSTLLNKSGSFSKTFNETANDNLKLIIKAVKYVITIDPNDFILRFNCDKTDKDNNTIFHLMCKDKDMDILKYIDILPQYLLQKNKQGQDIAAIAKEQDFIEMLELLHEGEDLYVTEKDNQSREYQYHKFAKDTDTKELSRILKNLDIDLTIKEARAGTDYINLNNKIDTKGNTPLQQLIKKYISGQEVSQQEAKKRLWQDIEKIIEYSDINYTQRVDGNSTLHLAVGYNHREIIDLLLEHPDLKLFTVNKQNQTVLDIAIHNRINDEIIQSIQNKMYLGTINKSMYQAMIDDADQRKQDDTAEYFKKNVKIDADIERKYKSSKADKVSEQNNHKQLSLTKAIELRELILGYDLDKLIFPEIQLPADIIDSYAQNLLGEIELIV